MSDDRPPLRSTVVDPETLGNLLEATGGDVAFLADLIDEFVGDGHNQVVEMRSAAAQGDATALTRSAHTLKSTAASFGAAALVERCRRLEADARAGRTEGAEGAIQAIAEDLDEVVAALVQWQSGQADAG